MSKRGQDDIVRVSCLRTKILGLDKKENVRSIYNLVMLKTHRIVFHSGCL